MCKTSIFWYLKCVDIFFQAGARWKPVRKLMNPMFHSKILQSFLPVFNEKTKNFVKSLENEDGNGAFDVMPYANICTLDAICCEFEENAHEKKTK